MSSYYVWLEYYAAAPISRNVKSSELRYATGHQHGVQPTPAQRNGLRPSLRANVAGAYATYNAMHPAAQVAAPAAAVIDGASVQRTRSAH